MAPFIILLTIPIVMAPFVKKIKINGYSLRYIPLFLFFVMLTLLLALRHPSVGNDTEEYIYYFQRTAWSSWGSVYKNGFELGFQTFMKLVSMISQDPRFFLVVCSITICALIYPTYRRLCEDSSLSIVIFCISPLFIMMFSGIRQMMALGIGCIAYEFVRRKKLVFFILAVVLAFLFHSSAFVLALMYPVYHFHITKKKLFFVVPVIVLLFIFNKPVFLLLGSILGNFTKFNFNIGETGAFAMLFLYIVFAVFAFLIPDESLLDKETIGLRNFLLLSVILQFFVPLHGLAMRMNDYYIIFIPLLIPRIINRSSIRWRQFAIVGRYVMIVFFYVYFFYNAYSPGVHLHVFPYYFLLESVV